MPSDSSLWLAGVSELEKVDVVHQRMCNTFDACWVDTTCSSAGIMDQATQNDSGGAHVENASFSTNQGPNGSNTTNGEVNGASQVNGNNEKPLGSSDSASAAINPPSLPEPSATNGVRNHDASSSASFDPFSTDNVSSPTDPFSPTNNGSMMDVDEPGTLSKPQELELMNGDEVASITGDTSMDGDNAMEEEDNKDESNNGGSNTAEQDEPSTTTFTHALFGGTAKIPDPFASTTAKESLKTPPSEPITVSGNDVSNNGESTTAEQDDPSTTTTFTHALFGGTAKISDPFASTTSKESLKTPPSEPITMSGNDGSNNGDSTTAEQDEPSTTTFTHALFGGTAKISDPFASTTAKESLKTPPSEPIPMSGNNDDDDKEAAMKKNQSKKDDEDDIEVLTKKQAEKEWRRKRKRQLQKQLDVANGVTPSFVAILEGPIDVAEDEEKEEKEETKDENGEVTITKILVNVDEYLSLGDYKKPIMVPSGPVKNRFMPAPVGGRPAPVPSSVLSSPRSSASPIDPDPKEEGYYEGVKLMAMPEDSIYLSEMQQWIRQNLEFFSATAMDAQMSQSGRRQRTVRGKVGVRCVHCARVLMPKFTSKLGTAAMKYEQWPPGSVSYPATMDGLYSSCSQRPQLHFKTCPHLSGAMRIQGAQWLSEEGEGAAAQKKRKRCREGVSALMYYHIACERIGLVETPGGLRFTRDLSLEPLPLEQAKHKIEESKPELAVKPRQRQQTVNYLPAAASSNPNVQVKMEKTPCTNEVCQQVIQEAVQEEDDLSVRLACKIDNEMVSDYTFLAIKQMAICWASPLDFVSRGKKTKLMRLGFAGFCCRHCNDKGIVTHACRSYSSAPDNLASAISNSFVLHLAKCPHTPDKIKQALVALKKIHSRQMQQLPYGSQRKCFMELWRRMRASDKIVEGQENPTPEQIQAASAEAGIATSTAFPDAVRSTSVETAIESNRKNARSAGFPVSSNEDTTRVLRKAEEEWDPTKDNDQLMDKDDRFLVSDYVFLTMRQLDMALPTSADFRGNRRATAMQRMAGMKCMHCSKEQGFVGSGRSFPSAPDNMASAFNTSLYNHMQACPGVPMELKSALYDLRKIHSMQCQNLVFGSQRKFFNKVFAKLKNVPLPESVLKELGPVTSPVRKPAYGSSAYRSPSYTNAIPTASDESLQKHSFVIGPALDGFPAFYQCQLCRAVPFAFRAPGCVQTSRPSTHVVVKHGMTCQGDGIFMGVVKKEYDAVTEDFEFLSQLESFRDLVRHVVGNDNDLTELFSDPEVEVKKDTRGWWRRLPANVDFDQAQKLFETIAADLKMESNRLQDKPKLVRYLQTISPSFQLPQASSQNNAGKVEDGNHSANNNTEAADVILKESSAASNNEAAPTVATSSDSTTAKPAGIPMEEEKPDTVVSETHFRSPVTATSDEQKEIEINDESSDEEGMMV